jgi:hypothetical protein
VRILPVFDEDHTSRLILKVNFRRKHKNTRSEARRSIEARPNTSLRALGLLVNLVKDDPSEQLAWIRRTINPREIERTPINHVLLHINVFRVHEDYIFDAIIIKRATFNISTVYERLVVIEH